MNSSPQAIPTLNFVLWTLLFVFAVGESIFELCSLNFVL